jgi:hypothetical protein
VSGIIKTIEIEDNKKVFLEVLINSVDAILYDGENLIDDPELHYIDNNHKLGIDETYTNNIIDFYKNISKYNITGFIRKHDVLLLNLDI